MATLILTLLVGKSASAQAADTPQVMSARAHGSTYDLSARFNPKTKLTIFVDGHKKSHAKFDKKGMATFKDIPLKTQGMLHFEKLTFKGYKNVGTTVFYEKNGNTFAFHSYAKPKYSYESFYKWINTIGMTESYWKWDGIGQHDLNTFNTINSHCGTTGDWSNPTWVACMQNAYSKYLKPETFTSDKNIYDFLAMAGEIESNPGIYATPESQYAMSKAVYARFAVTK